MKNRILTAAALVIAAKTTINPLQITRDYTASIGWQLAFLRM